MIIFSRAKKQSAFFTLSVVLIMSGIALLTLSGILGWSNVNTRTTERSNQTYRTMAAADAAVEKVIANMSADYDAGSETRVYGNLSAYGNMVPTSAESALWGNYEFNNAHGVVGKTYVDRAFTQINTNLPSQWTGLNGIASGYRVVANVRETSSMFNNLVCGVQQDVWLATVPIFQFAIFYSIDLEINPGATMNITGRVHGNGNIYMQPSGGTALTYKSDISAVNKLIHDKHPTDPNNRGSTYNITYGSGRAQGVGSLNLPIGTNNSATAIREVLQPPADGEDPGSQIGKQRYYNKADLVVLVSNSVVKSFYRAPASNDLTFTNISSWISITNTFFNKRENKWVKAIDVNVGRLTSWLTSNSYAVDTLYVADFRTMGASEETGVRLTNGAALPSGGLTVATPNPAYIKGHYNAPSADRGTTNTTHAEPASVAADAIMILSENWNDANSDDSLSSRIASDTTVNCALLSGIVPTEQIGSTKYYSGGAENFPRFLENWSSKTFTYNGSMVAMFYSYYANKHVGEVNGSDTYNPPNRNWAFDQNYTMGNRLPPSTPQAQYFIRKQWQEVRPNTVM